MPPGRSIQTTADPSKIIMAGTRQPAPRPKHQIICYQGGFSLILRNILRWVTEIQRCVGTENLLLRLHWEPHCRRGCQVAQPCTSVQVKLQGMQTVKEQLPTVACEQAMVYYHHARRNIHSIHYLCIWTVYVDRCHSALEHSYMFKGAQCQRAVSAMQSPCSAE